MSEVKITITRESPKGSLAIPRTEVRVDGKFCYQSMNHPDIEKEHIEILLDKMVIENIIVESI